VDEMTNPFTLSIEPTDGPAFQHGFHLGTDERIAKEFAEEIFRNRNTNHHATCTVALIRDRRIIDVYDGQWQSQRALDWECVDV
jgi:hypothetical protein